MRIRSFIRRRDWMTTPEWRLLLRHLRAYEALIAERGAPVTPFLVHLLDQALTMRLLVTRVEAQLLALDENGLPVLPEVDALDRIFDLRERLDDAMSALIDELEGRDACPAVQPESADSPETQEQAPSPTPALPPARLNRATRRALQKLARAQQPRPVVETPPLYDCVLT